MDDGPAAPDEDEPDVRFTYANERTFLAWNRTALALIATGVAATQLLPKLQVDWGRRLLGLPLIALGAIVAAESLRQWHANQRAMRRGDPLPRSRMPLDPHDRHRRGRRDRSGAQRFREPLIPWLPYRIRGIPGWPGSALPSPGIAPVWPSWSVSRCCCAMCGRCTAPIKSWRSD